MQSLLSLWRYVALPALLWASQVSLVVETDDSGSQICEPAPRWEIKGHVPMTGQLGNVVVVALLKAS